MTDGIDGLADRHDTLRDAVVELADEWERAADDPQVAPMSRHAYWDVAKCLRELVTEFETERDGDTS